MTDINKTWSLSDINIVVEKDSLDYPKLRLGIIDILDCSGVHAHCGGTEAYHRDINFVLFSEFDMSIAPLIGSGYHTFVSDQGTEGEYQVISATPTRLQALNYNTPIYRVSARFTKSGE